MPFPLTESLSWSAWPEAHFLCNLQLHQKSCYLPEQKKLFLVVSNLVAVTRFLRAIVGELWNAIWSEK